MSFTATSRAFIADAHTQNIYLMCRLLTEQGHTVIHYGNHGSDPVCTEHVEILDRTTMAALYADDEVAHAPNGYFCKQRPEIDRAFVERAVAEIGRRKQPGDFLLGLRDPHEEIYRHHKDLLYVHHSVGHVGWSPKTAVYASEYVRNFRFSKEHSRTKETTAWHASAVIPHFLDPDEFAPCYEPDDYFVFLGRLSQDKGLQIALDATRRLGARLVVAGPGKLTDFQTHDGVRFEGLITDIATRNALLRRARGLFAPTQMPEPFGMVVIEALFSGVPVITSDWGAFPETVAHGETGYRCTTLAEYVEAARSIDQISRRHCRALAERRFSLQHVGRLYANYFDRIADLHQHGFDSFKRNGLVAGDFSH